VSTQSIVRRPSPNFASGLTTAGLGLPDYTRALEQHAGYCAALEQCGLKLTHLPSDDHHPDSTFVEDTAVVTDRFAVLARPGAPSRLDEVASMQDALAGFYSTLYSIKEPGTLDGGDICKAGNHFFIGISARTNESGAQQFAELVALFNYSSEFIDIRQLDGLLHLKSGMAYLGDNRLVATDTLAHGEGFCDYRVLFVPETEKYAANCIRVNEHVLIAAGYPALEASLRNWGYETISLEMSEFQKMDGGLSCLSVRF
jgi:dimethylargininase